MTAPAAKILKASRSDPAWFLRHVLGSKIVTPQELTICDSVARHRRTAAPSGHGIGKTYIAARLALWFLFSHPRSKVLTTAPTWHQVENLLWREIRKAYNGSLYPLGGNLLRTELNVDEDWFALGLSTND